GYSDGLFSKKEALNLVNDAVDTWVLKLFGRQRKLTSAWLGRAPADTVRKAADVFDFLRVNPLAFFGNGSVFMTSNACAFRNAVHLCNILRYCHFEFLQIYFLLFVSRQKFTRLSDDANNRTIGKKAYS
ncbi:MAG: hypothetical protein IJB97_05960, partial [Clostridia bacterium]|nr:hypothetical protein [Clostridia bacterium]